MQRDEAFHVLQSKVKARLSWSGGCFVFVGSKTKAGYGFVTYKQKNYYLHRLSYSAFVGEIPKDKVVMHTCDTPGCINPLHLAVGTKGDNMKDMILKGRDHHPKGRGSGSLMSEAERLYIRQQVGSASCREIARQLGRSNYAVYRYVWGKTYGGEGLLR